MSDVSPDTERLSRAIERLTSRQPVPVFEDAELEELLELAGRLHHELPDDLPDPAFRDSLREQLLDPRPRLVPTAGSQSRLRRANPLTAASGVIAAVFVVAIAVGIVASGHFGGDEVVSDQSGDAGFLGTHSSVSALATVTATAGSLAALSTREPGNPFPTPGIASIPPIDAAHLEFGATTIASTAKPASAEQVVYTLMSTMPESQVSAPVYRFAVPEMDAMSLMNRVTNALDLDGEMTTRSVRGKTVIMFTSTNGTTFTWMPASGAFVCNLSGEASVEGGIGERITAAYEWLRASGFPLRGPLASPVVNEMEDGALRVDFPVEIAPDIAVGHPLTVSVNIDGDGVITTVSGYWLQLVEMQDIGLLSPEQAWQKLSEGHGFWSSRSPLGDSGHFEVESFQVAYVLTVDADNELVLQPVYRATGKFRDYRGSVIEGVSVMVQAATQGSP
jgi:hypothetical protein